MVDLPLFPLNTVLFPGMPLPLHIFEPRYIKMIGECIEQGAPFGVVLIKRGAEALGPAAEPHAVGCTARILRVERLPDGRMNIVAVGEDRFRILDLNHDEDYLTGDVEIYPLTEEDPKDLRVASNRLRPWLKRYLKMLIDAKFVQGEMSQLPTDPVELAYMAAFLLQTPPRQKQPLLEQDHLSDLLVDISAIYRREIALLNGLISTRQDEGRGNPSLN